MKRYMGQLLQFQHQEQVSHLQSIERGVAQVIWFLFVFFVALVSLLIFVELARTLQQGASLALV